MKKRKFLFPILAVLLAVLMISGVLLVPRMMPKDEVAVYPVTMVGYTDYYSGSTESYGMVTTDKVQPLYVSGTQTVTEILVYPGQSVKKGDVLYTYDTTLSDLAVERKTLANQQLEMELKPAQAELAALNAIAHPHILGEVRRRLAVYSESWSKTGEPIAVLVEPEPGL